MSAVQSTLLGAFVIATWFIDYLPSALCLSIASPDIDDAVLTLRVLRCLCYRPILLGEVSPSALQTLPSGLSATLLIRQTEMSPAVSNILNVAGHRGVPMLSNGRLLHLYCSRVVADSEHCRDLGNALRISLTLKAGQPSVPFTDEEAEELAQRFQGQLLRYRLEHTAHMAHSTFDASHFTWGTRQLVRLLGRPLASAVLQEQLVSLLADRDEETRAEQAIDCRSAVVEVLLACCHDSSLTRVYVAEVTEGVNALLGERLEDVTVGARRVGAVLKELGLCTERIDKSGRGLELRESTRRLIHRLAVQYGIGTADGAELCRHCGNRETEQ